MSMNSSPRQRFKKKKSKENFGKHIPDRWLNYDPVGRALEGTPFVPFKTPLDKSFFIGKRSLSADEHFDARRVGKTIGMVVDLTNTNRYYNKTDWEEYGIKYMDCRGKVAHNPAKHLHYLVRKVIKLIFQLHREQSNFILTAYESFTALFKWRPTIQRSAHELSGLLRRDYLFVVTPGLNTVAVLRSKTLKIDCPGHEVNRREDIVQNFLCTVDEFVNESINANKLIGVHCTHGLNRTGYLICRYLIDRMGWTATRAISEFEYSRGHPIERAHYKKSLYEAEKRKLKKASSLYKNDIG